MPDNTFLDRIENCELLGCAKIREARIALQCAKIRGTRIIEKWGCAKIRDAKIGGPKI